MGASLSRGPQLSEDKRAELTRKCKAFETALAGCRSANPETAIKTCKYLHIRLLSCYAETQAPAELAELTKCQNKLYKTGLYNGVGHCLQAEDAMKKALRKQGVKC